jgi:hypothetical protein
LSRDVTAWDTLDLRTQAGVPVPEGDRETIVDVASKALQDGYRDPKQVLQAATSVGRRAHLLENVRAYATRAIFRVKSKMEQLNEQSLSDVEYAAELPTAHKWITLKIGS